MYTIRGKLLLIIIAAAVCFSLAAGVASAEQPRPALREAVKVLRYSARIINLKNDEISELDLNFDGKLDVKDAIIILKIAAKMIDWPIVDLNQNSSGESVQSSEENPCSEDIILTDRAEIVTAKYETEDVPVADYKIEDFIMYGEKADNENLFIRYYQSPL